MKWVYYALSFVIFSTVFFTAFSGNAYAADLDDRYPYYTDTLSIQLQNDESTRLEINQHWAALIRNQTTGNSEIDSKARGYYSYIDGRFNDQPDPDTLNRFNNLIENGQYIVVQTPYPMGDADIFVLLSEGMATLEHTNNNYPGGEWGFTAPNFNDMLAFGIDMTSNANNIEIYQYTPGTVSTYITVSSQNPGNLAFSWNIYLNHMDNINYPPDWQGDDLKTNAPGNPIEVNHMRVNYTVQDKNIQGVILSPTNDGYIGNDWSKAQVKIYNQSDELLYTFTNPDDGVKFNFDFENYGEYKMVISHYTLPPYEPSEIQPLVIDPLVINGRTYVVHSNWLECDDNNNCNGATEDSVSPVQRALEDIAVNMHGLEQIIFLPIAFITTLPDKVNNCQSLNLPWLGNRNISVPCVKTGIVLSQPVLAATITGFMNGIVALAVGFGMFNFIRNLHQPEDDRVEVLKL